MIQNLPDSLLLRLLPIALLVMAGAVNAQSDKANDNGNATQVQNAGETAELVKEEPGPEDPRVQLLAAILLDDARGVQKLLSEGVDPNIREKERGPAIVMAVREQSFGAAQKLLASEKLDVNAVNARGETALMLAALHGNAATVDRLIEKGAELDKEGWTALHYAASGGHNRVVEQLLAAGADIDAISPNGTTALMLAARRGSFTPYQTLLKAGADPRITNESNLTAADYLDQLGESDRARVLRAYSAGFEPK